MGVIFTDAKLSQNIMSFPVVTSPCHLRPTFPNSPPAVVSCECVCCAHRDLPVTHAVCFDGSHHSGHHQPRRPAVFSEKQCLQWFREYTTADEPDLLGESPAGAPATTGITYRYGYRVQMQTAVLGTGGGNRIGTEGVEINTL